MAATATYGQRFNDSSEWYVSASYQHVGNRFTQPGDQEPGAGVFSAANGNPSLFFDPVTGAFGSRDTDIGSVRLPSYSLVNLSAGLKFDSGLEFVVYANNIFDKNPLLSFDRERGGRARLGHNVGTPRTIGLTARMAFGSAPRAAPVVVPPPTPAPPPATQTCADGSVILATDACPALPAPPEPAPAPERG